MTDTKDLTDKQKKFIEKYHMLCDWHYAEVKRKVEENLSKCELTKKELEQCLSQVQKDNLKVSMNDYVLDEFNDILYENEESSYFLENLKDDDIVKER